MQWRLAGCCKLDLLSEGDLMFEKVRPMIVRKIGWVMVVALCLSVLTGRALSTEKTTIDRTKPVVHIYPEKLSSKDKLHDGPDGKIIEIDAETTLIWVDLLPAARFAHDTEYLLVTAKGTKIIKGQWWPVLNGKPLMRGDERNQLDDLIIKR
jgi:hypothetical protein